MSPVEYRTILIYRPMYPLFPINDVCRKTCLDTFGEHAAHCREFPGFKCRHDLIRDVLIFLGMHEYLWRKRHMWSFWLIHKRGNQHFGWRMFYTWMGRRQNAYVDLTVFFRLLEWGSKILLSAILFFFFF
jgi:hypothetical protein